MNNHTSTRVVGNNLVRVACDEDHTFVYVPPRLDQPYLEGILSDSFGRSVRIRNCQTTNLCACVWGGVSHSGATVLQLSVDFGLGDNIDVVAKILCPDSVNLFKLDTHFSGREAEIVWAKWWGKQAISWTPKIYATQMDAAAREFWILQEFFPQVGWSDTPLEEPKFFCSDRGRLLLKHAAALHAYSRERITELLDLFPNDWPDMASLGADAAELADASFLESMGINDHEREAIGLFCRAVERRPAWVDEWELVCVTSDIAPDNVGIRRLETTEDLVMFDWSATRLGPMEAEIDILLGRLREGTYEEKEGLVRYYLNEYATQTGRSAPLLSTFMARLGWARFIVHLWRIVECVKQLRWVPFVTGPRDCIHLCVRVCEWLLPQLAFENIDSRK